jgi:hypothetical protein
MLLVILVASSSMGLGLDVPFFEMDSFHLSPEKTKIVNYLTWHIPTILNENAFLDYQLNVVSTIHKSKTKT